MFRLLLLLTCFPSLSNGQSVLNFNKDSQTKAYTQAIAEYIKAVKQTDKTIIDTLFIGRYEYLKDIKLPAKIQNTMIYKVTSDEEGDKILKHRKSFHYVNIVGPGLSKEPASFIFVRFFVEKSSGFTKWWPIHDCTLDLSYDAIGKLFKLDKDSFEYPYSNKYTKKK